MNMRDLNLATPSGSQEFSSNSSEVLKSDWHKLNLFSVAIILVGVNFILFAWLYLTPRVFAATKSTAPVAQTADKISPFTEVVSEGPAKVRMPEKAVPVLSQSEAPTQEGAVDSVDSTAAPSAPAVTVTHSSEQRRYVQTVERPAAAAATQVQSVDVSPAALLPQDYQIRGTAHQTADPNAPAIGYAVGVETH